MLCPPDHTRLDRPPATTWIPKRNARERHTMTTTTTTTMQAIVQDTYGSADVLRLDRIAPPEIADNEVLLRVHAAGLDRGTWHLMAGRPYLLRLIGFGLRRPKN